MLSSLILSIGVDGYYRAKSQVEVRYLDARNDEVISIIATEEKEGGFEVNIPIDVVEYLELKEENFVIFYQKLGNRKLVVPVKAGTGGRVALTGHFERLLRAMLSEAGISKFLDESGDVNWNKLKECGVILKFTVEPTGKTKILVLVPPDPHEGIRIHMGEGLANKLLVLKNFNFLRLNGL